MDSQRKERSFLFLCWDIPDTVSVTVRNCETLQVIKPERKLVVRTSQNASDFTNGDFEGDDDRSVPLSLVG